MNRRRVLGIVGALALTTLIGSAAAVKTKAAKVTACCCGDTCCCGADCGDACCGSPECCGDTCCCDSTMAKTRAVNVVGNESCCEDGAQAGSTSVLSQCPAIAIKQ